jgi:nitrite reductase/ring-hydroxylating ferredoxin subunit
MSSGHEHFGWRVIGTLETLRPMVVFDDDALVEVPLALALCDAPDLLVLLDEAGFPRAAIRRPCPHRGCDLATHAKPGKLQGSIECKHRHYAWLTATGAFVSTSASHRAEPLELLETYVDEADSIWAFDTPLEVAC